MPVHALALHRGLRHGGLVPRANSGPSVLDRLKNKAVRAQRQLSRTFTGDETKESILEDDWKAHLLEIGLISATTFAVGVAQGRGGKDAMKIGPVPWDLPLGGVLVAASVLRPAGRMAMPMRAVGAALLATHTMTWGRGAGKWWRDQKHLPPLSDVAGEPRVPATGGGALSDEELASVARRA
jgi:hypothetical protein